MIGIGLRNFRHRCANQHFKPLGPVEDRCYTHPHQIYLEWLVETGAIGFLGFLALIALWGRDLIRGLRTVDARDYPIAVGALAGAPGLPLAAALEHELLLELERDPVLADARPRACALRPAAGPRGRAAHLTRTTPVQPMSSSSRSEAADHALGSGAAAATTRPWMTACAAGCLIFLGSLAALAWQVHVRSRHGLGRWGSERAWLGLPDVFEWLDRPRGPSRSCCRRR